MSALPSIFAKYSWLDDPVNDESPCGPAIDYHPDFLVLQQQVSSTQSIEYGTFIQSPPIIKWSSLLPDLERLSTQTKDIRLIILLIRAHIAHHGMTAVVEGIALLIRLLKRWPEALHPQCDDEGEYVPEFRSNALSDLDDIEGCVAELRRYTFPTTEVEGCCLSNLEQWIVGDNTLSSADKARLQQHYASHLSFFQTCIDAQHQLNQLALLMPSSLGTESLSFPHLSALLNTFCQFHQRQQHAVLLHNDDAPSLPLITDGHLPLDSLAYRSEARAKLREIRENFAYYEPSSPLSLLLFFAEHSIGLDYQQVSRRFPRELIALITLEEGILE
ncbi:ImpA family type VI secretion system protein [Tatumella ptyseos]|uniref:type VI secretion system protein TssA n=1 Tax=Tatumella ptyseos TaxID=82987 RepID=UPI0026F0BFF4|nr:type VI secretion system ImpA family N-terminal domain-containing protein [Tatumella ptyseos]WKX27303.1 type VI secretion system ImpA family N-terminal domain-containing protein [Tatumella ptyseos]